MELFSKGQFLETRHTSFEVCRVSVFSFVITNAVLVRKIDKL